MTQNTVFCIARQYGSGGREVGLALAKALNIPFYDKELLQHAAKKSGILEEVFEKADERPSTSMLYSLSVLGVGADLLSRADLPTYMPNEAMQNIISDVIREVAAQSSCVIIGRCADYILRGQPGTISVFLHAELDKRIQRISKLKNLEEDAARSLIRKTDKSRANYYSFYTDREWNAIDNYDLAIDTGRLGVEKTVRLIQSAASFYSPYKLD